MSNIKPKNIFKHLKVISKHKYYVAKYCFKFGLYRQGIVHDLSKFHPTEFWTSVRYYQVNRSPVNAEKEDKGYSDAWLHHYHRNKHHWMYWIDFDNEQNIVPARIPYKYAIEAIADWIAAGIVYEKSNFTWSEPYEFYRDKIRINDEVSSKIFHPQTRQLWDTILVDLKKVGINRVCEYERDGVYRKIYTTDQLAKGIYTPYDKFDYETLLNEYYPEPNKETLKSKLVYVFLDVDGVLNDEDYIVKCYKHNGGHSMSMNDVPFDPKCLDNLMKLVNYINNKGYEVQIIMSSTWRLNLVDYEIVKSRLAEYGLRVDDKTDYISSVRGLEIEDYLKKHTNYSYYIVLDDDTKDIAPYHKNSNTVTTAFQTGFDDTKLSEAILKFNQYIAKETFNNGERQDN